MTRQNITIESTTKPENPKKGIKFGGEWYTVVGKAADYVKNIKPGKAQIDLNEEGNVIFIQQNGYEQKPKDTEESSETSYLENPKSSRNTVQHIVLSGLSDDELREALNSACEQYGSPQFNGDKGVFASQTHVADGLWCVVIFIRV